MKLDSIIGGEEPSPIVPGKVGSNRGIFAQWIYENPDNASILFVLTVGVLITIIVIQAIQISKLKK